MGTRGCKGPAVAIITTSHEEAQATCCSNWSLCLTLLTLFLPDP